VALAAVLLLAGAALLTEWWRGTGTSAAAVVTGAALGSAAVLAASQLPRRGPLPYALVAAIFIAAWLAVDLALGWTGDQDPHQVYRSEGQALLDGRAPHAEYPAGAILLFALETALGGGSPVVPNAVAMALCAVFTTLMLAHVDDTRDDWLSLAAALSPAALFFVLFRFDAAATVLVPAGLLASIRGRWALAGIALGAGAAVKWTPALALVPLLVWLIRRDRRSGLVLGGAALASFVLLNVPLFVLDPGSILSPYRLQSGRGVTGESIWALPLAALGRLDRTPAFWVSGVAPHWVDTLAVGVQLVLLIGLSIWAARAQTVRSAAAVAALAPVLLLLSNKIFSAQFLVPIAACILFAVAATAGSPTLRVSVVLLLTVAAAADGLVYPFRLGSFFDDVWPASLVFFAAALGAVACAVVSIRADRVAPLAPT